MRIYLDACCLHRPLDDQTQERIRIESEAIRQIIKMCIQGRCRWVSSEVVEAEVVRNPEKSRRSFVAAMLRFADERLILEEQHTALARTLASSGLGASDSLHVSLAELSGCDVLLTTDDDLIRRASRFRPALRVRVENPASWILEGAPNGT